MLSQQREILVKQMEPDNVTLTGSQIQIASSVANAESQTPIYISTYGGTKLRIESRISDKKAGELGHPVQWDPNEGSGSFTPIQIALISTH